MKFFDYFSQGQSDCSSLQWKPKIESPQKNYFPVSLCNCETWIKTDAQFETQASKAEVVPNHWSRAVKENSFLSMILSF